jgi:hypothetical protein
VKSNLILLLQVLKLAHKELEFDNWEEILEAYFQIVEKLEEK